MTDDRVVSSFNNAYRQLYKHNFPKKFVINRQMTNDGDNLRTEKINTAYLLPKIHRDQCV